MNFGFFMNFELKNAQQFHPVPKLYTVSQIIPQMEHFDLEKNISKTKSCSKKDRWHLEKKNLLLTYQRNVKPKNMPLGLYDFPNGEIWICEKAQSSL